MLEIKLANVKCNGCIATIKAGLADMAGVESVEVDLASATASIKGEGLERQAITQKLAELGYPEAE